MMMMEGIPFVYFRYASDEEYCFQDDMQHPMACALVPSSIQCIGKKNRQLPLKYSFSKFAIDSDHLRNFSTGGTPLHLEFKQH